MTKKVFIGAAWPYANNSLHLGHVAGLIGADIIARHARLSGNEVLYVSGSDCHGTPIVLTAEKEKIAPAQVADKYHKEFCDNLINGLGFSYDIYTTTLTKNHEEVVQEFFLDLYEKKLIYKKIQSLPYCDQCQRFLPDRYIEGKCPTCGFLSARGDQCDECGTILDPDQLIDPKCKACGSKPTWKESEHFFLKLSHFEKDLLGWAKKSEGWRSNAKNFTLKILEGGLHDRAITRDTAWGINIPLDGYEDKKIYVWFEAVCGYFSASKELSKKSGSDDWKKFWQDDKAIHYYAHGKDNIPFHSIIWPAILLGHGSLHLPDRIVSSEYLTLEKSQFSKSRNWAVWLPDFLKGFDGELLRYYLISNGPETSDADFSWKDFQVKINKELIGNFGNFIHRSLSLIKNNFPDGVELPKKLNDNQAEFVKLVDDSFDEVSNLIEQTKFKNAIKRVFEIVELGNKFLVEQKPWEQLKTDKEKAGADLAVCAYSICSLANLINPFLPTVTDRIGESLDCELARIWRKPTLTQFKVQKEIKTLFTKIEDEAVAREIAKLQSK